MNLVGFQESLNPKRLTRQNQVPYYVRWVQRFLWHFHGKIGDLPPDCILAFRRIEQRPSLRGGAPRIPHARVG